MPQTDEVRLIGLLLQAAEEVYASQPQTKKVVVMFLQGQAIRLEEAAGDFASTQTIIGQLARTLQHGYARLWRDAGEEIFQTLPHSG